MKLYYKGKRRKLRRTAAAANQILSNPEFYRRVAAKVKYDNSNVSGPEIADLIKNYEKSVQVKTYIAPTGANAKTKYSRYFKVNVARRIFRHRTNASVTRTLIHEYVHCVDIGTLPEGTQFTHVKNQNPNGEEDNTAPWYIGNIGKEMAEEIFK